MEMQTKLKLALAGALAAHAMMPATAGATCTVIPSRRRLHTAGLWLPRYND